MTQSLTERMLALTARNPALTRRSFVAATAASAATNLIPAGADIRPIMNDASRLNPTPVAKDWRPKSAPRDPLVEALRAELRDAAAAGRPVVVGAARHSMGAQSLAKDGTAITFAAPAIEPDTANGVYRVDAGARWFEIIKTLDPLGFSPAVMQSNADFGVASTFSVNSHGWPVPYGPFGSTVRALRLMLADGVVVECSRAKEPDLFAHAMGGYGLVGIILDLDVEMAKNVLLKPTNESIAPAEFGKRFVAAVTQDKSVLMAYGRLSVARASFFDQALMVTYRAVSPQPGKLPAATNASLMTGVSREIYRAQIGSEVAKRARWVAETRVNPSLSSGIATRNTLMNEPVSNLASGDRSRTDILHEYFVPPENLPAFLDACRRIIPSARAEFLNVTLRYVAADPIAVLAYAPAPRIALVMSFSQEISPEGEVDMIRTTEQLIDAAIAAGGTFYLPYRLHARRDQVRAAYPKAQAFAERKRALDPKLVFRHAMWDAYFA
jgi:FAD/FMN-containing dehydrogenase